MHTTEVPSQQLQNSLKYFAQYLTSLHRLTTFDSVTQAEQDAHKRLEFGFEELDSREKQITMQMQQMIELYARDRQMQITGRNPYEIIIEQDTAQLDKGTASDDTTKVTTASL